MKKRSIKAIFVCGIIFSASLSVTAQVYVKMRPAIVVVQARPVQPGPTYIWVGEDWLLDGSGYKYSGGYWEKPRVGYYRKTGYWKHDNRGHRWVPAGWIKQQQRGKGKWNGKHKAKKT